MPALAQTFAKFLLDAYKDSRTEKSMQMLEDLAPAATLRKLFHARGIATGLMVYRGKFTIFTVIGIASWKFGLPGSFDFLPVNEN